MSFAQTVKCLLADRNLQPTKGVEGPVNIGHKSVTVVTSRDGQHAAITLRQCACFVANLQFRENK